MVKIICFQCEGWGAGWEEAIGFDIPGQGTKILRVGCAVEPKHLKRKKKKHQEESHCPNARLTTELFFQIWYFYSFINLLVEL